VPLYRDLLRSVQLLDADESEGMSAMLFPRNRGLGAIAERALRERAFAAWNALSADHQELRQAIKQDEQLLRQCSQLVKVLNTYRSTVSPDDTNFWQPIDDFDDFLQDIASEHRRKRVRRE
jgi:hypothetical protein